MVKPIRFTDRFAVHPQIRPEALEEVAALGYRRVINNRPDGEEPGQPRSAELEAKAKALGLEYYHLPITLPGLHEAQIEQMEELVADQAPVFAFCRTGTRCAILHAIMAVRAGRPLAELLAEAARNGYDLTAQEPLIRHFGDQ